MYDKQPFIPVPGFPSEPSTAWPVIARALRDAAEPESSIGGRRVVCVECYPGVLVDDVRRQLAALLNPVLVVSTEDLLLPPQELDRNFPNCGQTE